MIEPGDDDPVPGGGAPEHHEGVRDPLADALDAIDAAVAAPEALREPVEADDGDARCEDSGATETAAPGPRQRPRRATKPKKERRPQAKRVMLDVGEGIELWRDRNGDGYGSFDDVAGVRQHAPIFSKAVRDHLALRFLAASGEVPTASAIEDVCRVLSAQAMTAPVHEPLLRIGWGSNNTIVVDKGDDTGAYFEIGPHGFQTLRDGRPRFVRRRGMTALCEPEPGSGIGLLRQFVNTENESAFILVVACLLGFLRPDGPFAILDLSAEQGAGKSVLTAWLRRLIDPSSSPISAPPKDMRDYLAFAINARMLCLDNVSKIDAELADVMCRFSTGTGVRARAFHTNADEILYSFSRPQIVNGIGGLSDRADLADRTIVVRLAAIKDGARRSEDELQREFAAAETAILGALFTAVSCGLRNFATTHLDQAPRLADFMRWCVACEPGLGDDWAPGSFLRAYGNNRADTRAAAFEADVVATKIDEFIRVERPEGWCGTATELLNLISARASDDLKRRRDWPYSAQGLGNRLDRAAPLLRARGLVIERRHSGVRTITITLRTPPEETP